MFKKITDSKNIVTYEFSLVLFEGNFTESSRIAVKINRKKKSTEFTSSRNILFIIFLFYDKKCLYK